MPTTSNFGWTTPADTDLVKDGAAAIRTLGNGIDTSLVDLKGGTTGQILSKNSNTDLDYIWINNDQGDITAVTAGTGLTGGGTTGAVTLTNDMATTITAKGDLLVGTGNATYDNLAVGTNGYTLVANSSTSTGLEWQAPAASGGMTLISTATPSAATSVQFASIATTYKTLLLVWDSCKDPTDNNGYFQLRLNNDSNTNYAFGGISKANTINFYESNADTKFGNGSDQGVIPRLQSSGSAYHQMGNGYCWIYNADQTTGPKRVVWSSTGYNPGDGQAQGPIHYNGIYRGTSAISQIDFIRTSTNQLTGTIRLYGLS